VSGARLSQYLSGRYKGDVESLDTRAEVYLAREEQKLREPLTRLKFCETSAYRKMEETLDTAYIEGDIAVVVGSSGVGKTVGAEHYCLEHPDCVFIDCDPSFTVRVLVNEILHKLGTQPCGTIHVAMEQIIQRLAGTGRMIVIDEAEHLSYRSLEIIRRIHDKTEIGLCLCGMQRLIENLRGGGQYQQLYSRIGVFCDLRTLEPNDIETILDQISASKETKHTLLASAKGNARTLQKLLKRTERLAKINGTEMTPEIVQKAEELLMV